GAAEVDQVKVDALDLRPAEVGAAEVGFPDLLGALVILLVVLVGVEARPAPLAGDRAADQAAPRGAEVEVGLAQVDAAEVHALPIDLSQAGSAERCALKVGAPQVGTRQQGAGQA